MFSAFDEFVLRSAGQIAGRNALFDKIAVKVSDISSVKMLPLVILLAYIWFERADDLRRRACVLGAVAGMLLAGTVSRLSQNLLPARPRPMHAGDPAFVAPISQNTEALENWSSFPSDHAAVVFALSTAVWCLSRRLGAVCYAWSVLMICLPRVYTGYHYASDLLAGAAIGIAAALVVHATLPMKAIAVRLNQLATRHPGPFYAASFLLLFQFATMFNDVRMVFRGLFKEL
ncbi:phosphatase PAP2 family protein [Methylobacterium nigriterrae]|uniref:phosphatase PAP2 family protein n=1 Tax=Methylobacterium nigriterrae TaxID=3127512 RepID=UPI003013C475